MDNLLVGTSLRAQVLGQKFDRLTVRSMTSERASNGEIYYRCDCECGGTKLASKTNLMRGYVASCGCLFRENYQGLRLASKKVKEQRSSYFAKPNVILKLLTQFSQELIDIDVYVNSALLYEKALTEQCRLDLDLFCDRWRISKSHFYDYLLRFGLPAAIIDINNYWSLLSKVPKQKRYYIGCRYCERIKRVSWGEFCRLNNLYCNCRLWLKVGEDAPEDLARIVRLALQAKYGGVFRRQKVVDYDAVFNDIYLTLFEEFSAGHEGADIRFNLYKLARKKATHIFGVAYKGFASVLPLNKRRNHNLKTFVNVLPEIIPKLESQYGKFAIVCLSFNFSIDNFFLIHDSFIQSSKDLEKLQHLKIFKIYEFIRFVHLDFIEGKFVGKVNLILFNY